MEGTCELFVEEGVKKTRISGVKTAVVDCETKLVESKEL